MYRFLSWMLWMLLFMGWHSGIRAQVSVPSLLLEENLEELAAEQEGVNWDDELEELARRLQEPLNLNEADRRQLEQFPFLTDAQIENLLAYLYIHGPMQTVYELQLVEGMDRRTIGLLQPFVCVRAKAERREFPTLAQLMKYGRHEAVARLDVPCYTRKGYEKAYLGPPPYHSLRYRFHYGEYLQVGVTGEKDAGEPFFALHDSKGYDYYSYYLQIRHLGWLDNLVLGNYRLSFGQGLVLGNSFQLGKTFSLATADYRSTGIRKHSSTDEYDYFRGLAATFSLPGSVQLSAFYSHRTLDGTLKEGKITSIAKTGLHRTASEVEKRNAFSLQMAGGNLAWQGRHLTVGTTGIYYFFNHPYEPALQKYARYNLRGQRFYNLGLDYRLLMGRFSWAGEAAKGSRGYAAVNRLSYAFSPDYRLLLVHRYYAHDYWAFFAHSFGEGTTPQNENGWYLAAEVAPFARWRFFVSGDFFSFPWWKYRISKPSQGIEGRFQATYTPSQTVSMYLNYRFKRRERDITGTGGSEILPTFQHRLRYRITCHPGAWLLRTTVEYNCFAQRSSSQGWQCSQLLSHTFSRFPLTLSLQGTCFHTDDYDSRVYVSEKSLLYTFYTPSFYSRGFRCSFHARYEPNKHLLFLLKFGETIYQDRENIGSGNDLIAGNRKGDVQMQMRVKF